MELLPGPGDRGVHFKCSRCGGGKQSFRHGEKTWLEITLTALYNLELQDKLKEGRRFFHVRQEICSFADRNWDVICLGRTRTPTWWATLNAQITTRTDLFETSKHGSGNWALRHSNISHPVTHPSDAALMDVAKECPPEKPATAKLNATAIVSKKVIGDRRFFLVTLESYTGTVWRESTHPCFKSGDLVRKFTKVDPVKDAPNGAANGSNGAHGGSQAKTKAAGRSRSNSRGTNVSSSPYANGYATNANGVPLGVFTEKVVKAPSRLSKRQQSKRDAAIAANAAAVAARNAASSATSHTASTSSSSHSTSSTHTKQLSAMAESYRKTSKIASGQIDPNSITSYNSVTTRNSSHNVQHIAHTHNHFANGSLSTAATGSPNGQLLSNGSGMMSGAAYMNAAAAAAAAAGGKGAPVVMTKLPNGQLVNAMQLKLAQSPQPMRCHQCNRRQLSRPKPGQEFVFCTHTMTKVQGEMTLNVACTQSYCRTCIDLIYHEHPLEDEHETATWICPACRKICTCATCNDYVDPTGQTPPCNMVVTSSMPTAQLQQQQQYQLQMHQPYKSIPGGSASSVPVNSSSSSISTQHSLSYDGSDSPLGEDAASSTSGTTASYTASPSAKSTPNGPTSISPNASVWSGSASSPSSNSSGMSSNGIPLNSGGMSSVGGKQHPPRSQLFDNKQSVKNVLHIAAKIDRKSKIRTLVRTSDTGTLKWVTDKVTKDGSTLTQRTASKLDTQLHDEYDSSMKIVIPAYDPNAAPPPKRETKPVPASPSPHNTRSNTGTRSTQHLLSLYTQSLVSRSPSGRRKNSTSSTGGSSSNGSGESSPQHGSSSPSSSSRHTSSASNGSSSHNGGISSATHQHQSASYAAAAVSNGGGEYAWRPSSKSAKSMPLNASGSANGANRRGGPGPSHHNSEPLSVNTANTLMAYPGLHSPTGDVFGGERPHLAKGKRPYPDLTSSSAAELQRPRESASKRRALTTGSLDDMSDIFADLTSPRQLLPFDPDDDDSTAHHHHANGSHVSSTHTINPHNLVLDDSIAKDGVVPTDGLVTVPGVTGEEHILHTHHVATAAPSINPAMMMSEFYDGDGHIDNIPSDNWSEPPISVVASYESGSYF